MALYTSYIYIYIFPAWLTPSLIVQRNKKQEAQGIIYTCEQAYSLTNKIKLLIFNKLQQLHITITGILKKIKSI